jgi:lipid-binding SYLF domain-containing protein
MGVMTLASAAAIFFVTAVGAQTGYHQPTPAARARTVNTTPAPTSTGAGVDNSKYDRLIVTSNDVLNQALTRQSGAIPPQLLSQCRAVVIIPNAVRAAFFWGGRFGEGLTVARTASGAWSAPSFYTLSGGSWGFQFGAEQVDIVMLIMNDRGFEALLKQKFTIGGDVSATAGPNTASAQADIDVALRADIVTYARARGLFAGIALRGARLAPSPRTNRDYYGRPLTVDAILVRNEPAMPAAAGGLMGTLASFK